MITTEYSGIDTLIAKFTGYPDSIHQALVRGITKLGYTLLGIVVDDKLSGGVLNRVSGRLASAQNLAVTDTGPGVIASVGFNSNTVPWGKFQEDGVPHDWLITAKNAKALRFELGGLVMYRRSVVHPPLPARSFLKSALRDIAPQVVPVLSAEIAAELKK